MAQPGEQLRHLWYPIARSDDAPMRHVYQGKLLGRELAVWRADDGHVNVWENRCLHRGVRLSLGLNRGLELSCAYHGWRYANRTGECTYIPAHPADAPARTICNRSFEATERYGLIWSTEAGTTDLGIVPKLEAGDAFALRCLPVIAPTELVVGMLSAYQFQPSSDLDATGAGVAVTYADSQRVELLSSSGDEQSSVVFFVQPVDDEQCVVRGVLTETPAEQHQLAVLRHHGAQLEAIRVAIEDASQALPTPAAPGAVDQVSSPAVVQIAVDARLRVVVAHKSTAVRDVATFELAALAGELPSCQPGAHIDVHLPNGLSRQYSLTNRPGSDRYVIGVKREAESRGGSSYLHDAVGEGDVLEISGPRNNFPLRRDALRTVLIAGGIGITPLLSMASTLFADGRLFELHYFAQSQDQVAFGPELETFGSSVQIHLGRSPSETGGLLGEILARYEAASHLYVCGPGPMLDRARELAANASWPDETVHFEYFKNAAVVDDSSSFEISLARSALTLSVDQGQTILEVLRNNAIDIASSCEQGACGTCMATVLEGEVLHQDVYLNDTARRAGDQILTCVSRATSARLVLDL